MCKNLAFNTGDCVSLVAPIQHKPVGPINIGRDCPLLCRKSANFDTICTLLLTRNWSVTRCDDYVITTELKQVLESLSFNRESRDNLKLKWNIFPCLSLTFVEFNRLPAPPAEKSNYPWKELTHIAKLLQEGGRERMGVQFAMSRIYINRDDGLYK